MFSARDAQILESGFFLPRCLLHDIRLGSFHRVSVRYKISTYSTVIRPEIPQVISCLSTCSGAAVANDLAL